jgi:hypothetical protein
MPGPQKSIRKLSADKALAKVFWDNKGKLLIVLFQKRRTGEYSTKSLIKLIKRIRSKRENMQKEEYFLFSRKRKLQISKDFYRGKRDRLGSIKLYHPLYRSGLAP